MLSRDKRLPFDTWNTSELQENVFGNQFSTFDPHRHPSQGIHSAEFFAKTANIGAAIRQVPYTFFIPMLEDKIQEPSVPLVLIFHRKLRYGSKKWLWSIHWMN